MPPTNSLGAGPPKQRTINVEVNLLAEWLEQRTRLREERLRWTGLLTTLAVIGIITIPFLSEMAANAEGHAKKAEKAALARETALTALQKQQTVVQPKIDGDATLQLCRSRSNIFMGEMLAILNATTPQMAVEQVEGSVLGGEITLRSKAQSETYLAAQEYVAAAGLGGGVRSAILTTARPNESLTLDGVTFEFVKKVEVRK